MKTLKKTYHLLSCVIISAVLILIVSCEPETVLPNCNLKVLDAEITLTSIDTMVIAGAPRTIYIEPGLHVIHGTSTRQRCVDGQDVVGTIFGVVNPLSAARIFIQELTGSSSRETDYWGVGVWVQGAPDEQFEINAIMVDPIDADHIRSLAKDSATIHDINDLKVTLNDNDIYFKDSRSVFVKLN